MLFREVPGNLGGQPRRATTRAIQWTPLGDRCSQHFFVLVANYLCMPEIAQAAYRSCPCPRRNRVAEQRLSGVVNFVPQRHPNILRPMFRRCQKRPMSHCNVLHPRKVDNIVDMTQFVDVARVDTNVQFERRDWGFVGLHHHILPRLVDSLNRFSIKGYCTGLTA